MKQNLITDVIQGMLPYLNNAQTERLQEVLQHTLFDYEVTKTEIVSVFPTIKVQGGIVAWSMILDAKSRQPELKKS